MWQCNAEERLGKWTFWIIFHEFWCTLFFVSLTAFYSRYLSIQWLICNVDPFGTNAHVHIWAVFGLLLHQEGPYESDFCKAPFKNGIDAKTECVFFAFLKFVKFWNILHEKEWDLSRKKTCQCNLGLMGPHDSYTLCDSIFTFTVPFSFSQPFFFLSLHSFLDVKLW